jgi:hypothetical protein
MAKRAAANSSAVNIKELREDFDHIIQKLDATLKEAPKIFPSGIELIQVTLKAGSNIELSVVVAGKDGVKGTQTPPTTD